MIVEEEDLIDYIGNDVNSLEGKIKGFTLKKLIKYAENEDGEYYNSVKSELSKYNGFNIILGEINNLYYFSTHTEGLRKLEPGVYGLSNAVLDTHWPKVEKSKTQLLKLMEQKEIHAWELLSLLGDTSKAKEKDLPDTGVGPEWERVLSSVFIQSAKYGTRCSTAILIDNYNNVRFAEKTFFGHQGAFSNKDYNFKIEN